MDRIESIAKKCKCSFSIEFNRHRDYYQSVEEYFQGINEEPTKEMIESDTIIQIQAYVNTPVGFILVYSHDYETAIKEMEEVFKEEKVQ